jgi:hypothetical protein
MTPRTRLSARSLALFGAAVAMLGVAACTDEQRQALGEEDLRDSLRGRIVDVLEGDDLELDGDLLCVAAIADGSAATAGCEGTTTSGAAVAGTYDGTADIDAETCTARFDVVVDGAAIAGEDDVDCFDVP